MYYELASTIFFASDWQYVLAGVARAAPSGDASKGNTPAGGEGNDGAAKIERAGQKGTDAVEEGGDAEEEAEEEHGSGKQVKNVFSCS